MIEIKHSKYMDMSPIGEAENFMCRLSTKNRYLLGLSIGDTVKISNSNGEAVLKVGWAYENDTKCYPNFSGVYLSSYVYNKLSPLPNADVVPIPGITFGADPEAYLIDDIEGHLIEASTCFNYGYIGHDFGLVEFRPDPSDSIIGLTINLYTLILASQMYTKPGTHIHSASMYTFNPAGFHIHFGIDNVLKDNTEDFMKTLASVLDFFVSVPAMYFEKGDDWCRRVTSDYGTPGDIRKSTFSFEYRTLGGHILSDPRITCFILLLAETIVTDMYNVYLESPDIITGYNKIQRVYPTLPSREIVSEMLKTQKGKQFAERYIESILTAMNYFSKYDLISYFSGIKTLVYDNNLVKSWMFNTKPAIDSIREVLI